MQAQVASLQASTPFQSLAAKRLTSGQASCSAAAAPIRPACAASPAPPPASPSGSEKLSHLGLRETFTRGWEAHPQPARHEEPPFLGFRELQKSKHFTDFDKKVISTANKVFNAAANREMSYIPLPWVEADEHVDVLQGFWGASPCLQSLFESPDRFVDTWRSERAVWTDHEGASDVGKLIKSLHLAKHAMGAMREVDWKQRLPASAGLLSHFWRIKRDYLEARVEDCKTPSWFAEMTQAVQISVTKRT